ncbi:hypothetical protein ACFX12_038891 [Malus domestica]
MEKILSVNHILHLTRARSMALAMAATSYTTLAPPPQLQRPLTIPNKDSPVAPSAAMISFTTLSNHTSTNPKTRKT